jgi:hypothetical protein
VKAEVIGACACLQRQPTYPTCRSFEHFVGCPLFDTQPELQKAHANEYAKHNAPKKPARVQKGFVALIGLIHDAAEKCGYAVGVHGSMGRDLDLIAVPWTKEATTASALAEEIRHVINGKIYSLMTLPGSSNHAPNPQTKAHGRICYVIHQGDGPYIDLSIMPRKRARKKRQSCPHCPPD